MEAIASIVYHLTLATCCIVATKVLWDVAYDIQNPITEGDDDESIY